MSSAGEITSTLTRLGHPVAERDIAEAEAGLDGLTDDQKRAVILATYGVDSDNRPTGHFLADRGPWRAIVHLLGRGRKTMIFLFVAALAGLVPTLAVPLLLRLFVDRYLVAGDDLWVTPVLIGLIGSALVSGMVIALQYAILRLFVLHLSRAGQVGFMWHTLNMPPPEVARFGAGDLIARLNLRQRLSYQGGLLLPLAGVNVLNAVVFSVALLALDVRVGLAATGIAALSVLLSLLVLRRRRAVQTLADDELVRLSSITAEVVGSIESIKAASWEQFAFSRWAAARRRAARALSRLGVVNQWIVLIPATATALGLGAVLAVGCLLVMSGDISLGTVVAAQAFAVLLLDALAQLVWFGVLFQFVVSAADQTDTLLRVPLDPEVIEVDDTGATPELRGEIALRDITFGYDRTDPPLIEGLDLDIPAGSRLALVGSSGSGKTTIARLVIGELRPWRGRVLLDDTPRLLVPRPARSAQLAYVPQESTLFPGTIRDNLTMWDETVSDEQVQIAAQDACIESAILSRAGGFYAVVTGRDSGFSGGEMQRLAIARALVSDPRILILDEATSALDPVVEAEVEANVRRRGCTCLIVAHRLSTVRDADEILVIEGGRVVQKGQYDDIKRHGQFAELIHG